MSLTFCPLELCRTASVFVSLLTPAVSVWAVEAGMDEAGGVCVAPSDTMSLTHNHTEKK